MEHKTQSQTNDAVKGLSSDDVWKLIEPKINEYWRIGKTVAWLLTAVVGGLVTFFVGIVISVLKIDAVKEGLVKSVVTINGIFDDKGKEFLHSQIDEYFQSEQLALKFDSAPAWPLRSKAMAAVGSIFEQSVNSILVTYSFSTGFILSDSQRSHNLRILKPEGNTADIECAATYPDASAKKIVNVLLNHNADFGGGNTETEFLGREG